MSLPVQRSVIGMIPIFFGIDFTLQFEGTLFASHRKRTSAPKRSMGSETLNYNRPTNRPTYRQAHREVSLPIMSFKMLEVKLPYDLAGPSIGRLVCLSKVPKRAESYTSMLLSEHCFVCNPLTVLSNLFCGYVKELHHSSINCLQTAFKH